MTEKINTDQPYDQQNRIPRISMIEDNDVIRNNVTKYIGFHEEFEVVDVFGSVESFFHKMEIDPRFRFDILLLDIGLPGISGIEGIPLIKEKMPDADIIMLTTYEEEDVILKAICSGACSYLSKKEELADIVEAIRVVANGGSYMSPQIAREIVRHLMGGIKKQPNKPSMLSERQLQILKGLVDGKTYNAIGKELFISAHTVKCHIKKLYRVLQVNNKAEAIAMYLKGEVR